MGDPVEPRETGESAGPNLRFLRALVTILTTVMIAGTLLVVVLLVTRLNRISAPAPDSIALPDRVELPEGTTAEAFTRGRDWFAIVTDDNRILVFDAESGELRQTVTLE